MKTLIVWLRGVNVGGKNRLPMKAWREQLEALGARDVRTYIQSGNAVFRSAKGSVKSWQDRIAAEIESQQGFRPQVLILDSCQLARVVAENPYPQLTDQPKALHVFFWDRASSAPRLDEMRRLKSESESFELGTHALYMAAPEGIGRSRLAAAVERLLGVPVSARNWRTVMALQAMAEELAA